jgi:hypothetical protein
MIELLNKRCTGDDSHSVAAKFCRKGAVTAVFVFLFFVHMDAQSDSSYYIVPDVPVSGSEHVYTIHRDTSSADKVSPLDDDGGAGRYIHEERNGSICGKKYIYVKPPQVESDAPKTPKSKSKKNDEEATVFGERTISENIFSRAAITLIPSPGLPTSLFAVCHTGMTALVSQTQRKGHQKNKTDNMFACVIFDPSGGGNRSASGFILPGTMQRQKFSPAAIQSGLLTSSGTNSPPYRR